MNFLLDILRGQITSRKITVQLYCVGTGTGTTGTVETAHFFFLFYSVK